MTRPWTMLKNVGLGLIHGRLPKNQKSKGGSPPLDPPLVMWGDKCIWTQQWSGHWKGIGHFPITLSLVLKTNIRCAFSHEWLCAMPCFDKKAKGISEMGKW